MTPPRIASALLGLLIRRDLVEYVAGDLEEEYARRAGRFGPAAARRWYWAETFRLICAVPRRPPPPDRRVAAPPARDSAWMAFVGDLRYGARALARTPGYSIVAVATLALAIGANTVIFSFANVLLIRPLPIERPENLAFLYSVDPHSSPRGKVSFADYRDFSDRSTAFEGLAAWTDVDVTLTGRGEALRLQARQTTANLFTLWGLRPVTGRLFRGDDRACSIVLSDHLWATLFQRSPTATGASLAINGRACTIVGVMTPAIEIGNLSLIDFWMPPDGRELRQSRDDRTFSVTGRLREGVTLDRAGADIRSIAEQLQREHPDTNAGWTTRTLDTRHAMMGEHSWLIFGLLMLVVGFVLLIACANIANLVLARSSGRREELAVRMALGATPWAIVRQLVAESLLLGAAGGALGVAVAEGGLRAIRAAAYEPFFSLVAIDWHVLAFAAAVSIAAPFVFAVLPALHAASDTFSERLHAGARAGVGRLARRGRSALVVAQVALAIVLLIVSGLVIRTMVTLNTVEFGTDPRTVVTARVELPARKYTSNADVVRFYDRVCERLSAVPGIDGCAVATGIPVLGAGPRVQFDVEGQPPSSAAERPWALRFAATPGYAAATGIRLLRGRWFTAVDVPGAAPVVVLNREAARRYFRSPDEAVGSRMTLRAGDVEQKVEVVGVIANITNHDMEMGPSPHVFVPVAQHPVLSAMVIVRSAAGSASAPTLRSMVSAVDGDVPAFQIRSIQTALDAEASSGRIFTTLFVAFGALALVLATAGLYAVISFVVSQRRQEIGVRLALGASPGHILQLVFGEGLVLVAAGTALGLAGGAVTGRSMASTLFGVTPFDPLTYAVVVSVVLASSAVAIWSPARRALRLDPIRTLKAD